jgi:hypothetical protein
MNGLKPGWLPGSMEATNAMQEGAAMNKKTENPSPENDDVFVEKPTGAGDSNQGPAEQNAAESKTGAAPDPFDPAQFAAPSTVLGEVGVIKELTTCPVRKPNRQEFVRVHPGEEYRLRAHILELKQEKETYLVMPAVAAALPGETVLVTLRLAVSRQGAVFLWPIPEPSLDGRENAWHPSRRAAAARAETDWVKVVANMAQGSYDLFVAPGALGTPMWPDKSMRDILSIAFGENFIIRDAGHPVIKRLMGLA